ncbi:uncharacterized protein LOC132734532 [Ruditapes philippinarum]|uniref:uncharacterized protein LOC132734532 n=1 Tax=Ruditapes philippinarum TaxID=129788 RepID=UPI00295B2AB3|nr:uncharacterized protein LOC132734532 [Ruditapes philippinarum]
MPEIRSTWLTSSSSDGVAPTSQNGHDGTTDAAEPDVVAENMKSEKQVWTKPAVLKRIALHQDHEADFRKPSLKKTRNVSIGHGCPHTPLFCQSYDSRSNIFWTTCATS